MTLAAAIVGLGRWGQRLSESVAGSDQIRIVRGATRTPAKAEAFAAAQGFPLGDSYEEILRDPGIAAVVLATPHSQHAAQIEAAAAAGKHVFVEKPVTLNRTSAEQAIAACRRAGVVLAAGHNRRFLPSILTLAELIRGGTLGQVLHAEGHFSGASAMSYAKDMWRADPDESPAGGLAAMGIHTIDTYVGLFGPIEEVRCLSFRQALGVPIDDTTSMLFRFRNGMSGYLGTLTATPRAWRLSVYGTKGWAHLTDQNTMILSLKDGEVETRRFPAVDIERAELEAFAAAVAGKKPYPVPFDEVVHGIGVFEAVVASAAKDGAPVRLT
jgi:predicted dehydrogenase